MLNKFLAVIFISISLVPAKDIKYGQTGGYFHSKNMFRDLYLTTDDCHNSGFVYYPLVCSSHFADEIYDKYLIFDPNLKGMMSIELTICHDGYVADDYVWTSTVDRKVGSKFREDIRNMFYSYRWEKIDSGTTVTRQNIHFDRYGIELRKGTYKDSKLFENNLEKSDSQNSSLDSSKELNSFFWRDKIKAISLETVVIESDGVVRSEQEIIRIVNTHRQVLRDVYNKHFELKSGFNGKVTLRLIIAHRGDITDISIVSSTTDYTEFNDAIKDVVAHWKWDPIKKCDYDTVAITLNFQTSIPKPFYYIFNYIATILDSRLPRCPVRCPQR
jgi:hypothetical protein